MASLEEMRGLLRTNNQELQQTIAQSVADTVMVQVNILLDTKLKLSEEKLLASISDLTRRTAQLERAMNENEGVGGDTQGSRKKGRYDGSSSGSHGSRSTRASSASAGSRSDMANPSAVWMLFFPVELMEIKLRRFASATVEERMRGWSERIVVKARNLDQKLCIEFDSEFGAHKFLDLCRNHPIKYELTALRVRPDRTAEVRHRNRIMGKLWHQVEEHIRESMPGHKVGQNGPKGKVFVVDPTGEEVVIIFKTSNHGADNMVIEVQEEGCKHIGLSEEKARDFVDTAKAQAEGGRNSQ